MEAIREEEHEVQMIEREVQKRSLVNDYLIWAMEILIYISECARLALCVVGVCALVERFICHKRRKAATRTVATQSQCTYTSVRGVKEPRFQIVSADEQGVTVARRAG